MFFLVICLKESYEDCKFVYFKESKGGLVKIYIEDFMVFSYHLLKE